MTMREDPPQLSSFSQPRACLDIQVPPPEGMCIDRVSGQRPLPTNLDDNISEVQRADEDARVFALRGRGRFEDHGSEMGINMHLRRTQTLAYAATSTSSSTSNSSASSSSTFASKGSVPDTNYTFVGSSGHRPNLPSISAITNPQAVPSMTAAAVSPRWPSHLQGSPQMKRLVPCQTLPPLMPQAYGLGKEAYPSASTPVRNLSNASRVHRENSFSSTSPLLRPLQLPLPTGNGYSDVPPTVVGHARRNSASIRGVTEVASRRSSSAYDDDDDVPVVSPGYASSTSSRNAYIEEDTPQPFNSRKRVKTWSHSLEMQTPTTTTSGVSRMEITEEDDEEEMKDEPSPKASRSLSEASTTLEKDLNALEPLKLKDGITPANFPRWLQLWNSGLTSKGNQGLKEDHNPASDMTPLHMAVCTGKMDIVQLLVSSGADFTRTTSKGQNPLHFAAALKDSTILEYMLSLSTSVQYSNQIVDALVRRDYLGRTPILVAAREGTLRSVKALLEAGAVINSTTSVGRLNVISHAVRGNNVEVLRYFLGDSIDGTGARPKLSVSSKWCSYTPLQDACANGRFEIAELLLLRGADPDLEAAEPYDIPLLSAIRRRDQRMVKLLLQHSASVNKVGIFGELPLHAAAKTGDGWTTEALIERGAMWHRTDSNGDTPLHIAARCGHRDCVSALILCSGSSKEDVNIKNSRGWTPLHAAASIGNLEVARLLLEARGDPNLADKQGLTPLHLALQNVRDANLDLIGVLLDQTDLTAARTTLNGETLLHIAASSGNVELARILLKVKNLESIIDINNKTNRGLTALHIAVERQDVGIVTELLRAGCDASLLNNDGQSALHLAIASENIETIRLLIERGGADLNMPVGFASEGSNASHDASRSSPAKSPPAPSLVQYATAPSPPSSAGAGGPASAKPKSYKCPHCNILIKPPKMNLQRHIAQLHREKVRFACPYPGCNVTTSRQDNWKMHLRRHEEKRKKEKERYKDMQKSAAEKGGRGPKSKDEKKVKVDDQ